MGLIGNISFLYGTGLGSINMAEPGNVMQIRLLPEVVVGHNVTEVVILVFPKFDQKAEVVTNI